MNPFSIFALALKRRQEKQRQEAEAISQPIVTELRDLKAMLQKHHESGSRIAPG